MVQVRFYLKDGYEAKFFIMQSMHLHPCRPKQPCHPQQQKAVIKQCQYSFVFDEQTSSSFLSPHWYKEIFLKWGKITWQLQSSFDIIIKNCDWCKCKIITLFPFLCCGLLFKNKNLRAFSPPMSPPMTNKVDKISDQANKEKIRFLNEEL